MWNNILFENKNDFPIFVRKDKSKRLSGSMLECVHLNTFSIKISIMKIFEKKKRKKIIFSTVKPLGI